MTKSPSEIMADLEAAMPLEDVPSVIRAIIDALNDYAETVRATEPHATNSVRHYEQAAQTLDNLLDALTADHDAEQPFSWNS